MIPEFAILGHPNEGKSSVVSTLTEDDSIKVSRTPGETRESKSYTVSLDGKPLIRFVDTPGFQAPRQVLSWFQSYDGQADQITAQFVKTFKIDPFFRDECELLDPLTRGAGIIYVVDGSRPVRQDDLAEMEIMRLTGRPRMAIINSKTDQQDYTPDWNMEFRKHFNAIRVFNSNTASFMDRILMLESLKSIDQEWEPRLISVIQAFKTDWEQRIRTAGTIILDTIGAGISFSISSGLKPGMDQGPVHDKLTKKYQTHIRRQESLMFQKIRLLFKHRQFEFHLPSYSLLNHDLFSKQTFELLGLSRDQLALAGAVLGGTLGAAIDTAAAGITFGVFTAVGSLLGAGSAALGGKKMSQQKKGGFRLGSDVLRLGPCKDPQFLFVMLDRAFIYYSHMVSRPHGRRDLPAPPLAANGLKQGVTSGFSQAQRGICLRYFKHLTRRRIIKDDKSIQAFESLIRSVLSDMASSQGH